MDVPAGNVAFLFTDVEGSTSLLQHLGDSYDDVLLEHNRLLREVWSAHGGYEVSTEGDAFFVSFADPDAALSAARDAQLAIARATWPDGCELRVRMGLHRGEARVYDGDYVGLAVHQAARIASAAHGGQVILSEDIQRAASGDVSFIDLGPHRLKDLAQPIRLYQLAGQDLPSEFPPPRTLTVLPNNFPLQLTTFVGRTDDIAGLRGAIAGSRLVTLTGAGGVGKTRLALQVAADVLDEFPDGAWLVDLAPLADPDLLASALAVALGVREQPGRDLVRTLCDHLRSRRTLILLDNCEHLIDVCAKLVHEILSVCADVHVLTTSREALNLPGEVAWRLRSLTLPPVDPSSSLATFARTEAIRLFVQRTRAVRPDYELTDENVAAIAQICRRLDGLPLAMELAAARMRSMSAHEIAERLDDRFRLLTGGSRSSLPRQRTLEATVSWSYDLLSEVERLLFERLSVFAGGWTIESADAVCSDDELESLDIADMLAVLVDRSLVVPEETADGRTRYRMLETLRQFGRDRLLEAGEASSIRSRHLAWAVELAERSPPQTGNLAPPEMLVEEDNLRIALEWAAETEDHRSGLRILAAAWFGHFEERRRSLDRFLPFVDSIPVDVAGRVLFAAGGLAFMTGDWQWGVETLHRAAECNAQAGNDLRTSMSLAYAGSCHWGLGEVDEALVLMEQALAVARASANIPALARALLTRTWFETERSVGVAEELAIECESVSAKLDIVFDVGHCREVRGYIYCLKGEYDVAAEVLAEAASMFKDIQVNCASHILETAAAWAVMTDRAELAAELLGAAEEIREATADKPRPWERVVHAEYLPLIRDRLDAETFDRARARGRERSVEDALLFAEHELRAAAARVRPRSD